LFNRLGGFGSLLVLDARSADAYKASHVPRSLNIPLTDGDLVAVQQDEAQEGELQPAECTAMLSALEQRLHMTDQRAFRMRQRCTVVIVGLPPLDNDEDAAAVDAAPAAGPPAFSAAPYLSSRHHRHTLHLARLLVGEGKVAAVSVLTGGFDLFARRYPFVCCAYTAQELKSGKHIHKKPFPYYPNEILSGAAAVPGSEVTDNATGGVVYLGSKVDASNQAHLQHLGITHVLNCTAEIPCHFEDDRLEDGVTPAFTYHRIDGLADEVSVAISDHFAAAFAFLDAARAANKRVLVHCQEGISRSSTITIAYLMSRYTRTTPEGKQEPLSLHDAYHWVKANRKQVFPNLGFWRQLSNFELTLQRERLLEEARSSRGLSAEEAEATVPPLNELKGTLHDCIDVELLTAEYKARKANQEAAAASAAAAAAGTDGAAAAASSSSSDADADVVVAGDGGVESASQRLARAVFSPNSNTLRAVKGVASEDARDRAQEAIVEEAQTPCGPVVTSDS
jgi:protein-tyrosine phosphatase